MTERSQPGRRRWRVLILIFLAAGLVGTRAIWRQHAADPLAPAEDAYRRGDWTAADRLAADRLRIAPDDRRAIRLRARAAARTNNDNTARSLYARLGGASAMEPEDFWLFGRIIDRLGNRDVARDCWIEGLRLSPSNPDLLREIALDRLETGKPIQAANFARKLAAQPGWQAAGHIVLGQALAADDDPRGAAECWALALSNDPPQGPETTSLRLAIARARLRAGEPALARAILQSGPPLKEDAPGTAWLLARADLQEKSLASSEARLAASRRYREAHPLEPEPSPYVGSARCRECHAAIADSVRASRHARTFQRAPGIALRSIPDKPIPDPGDPAIPHHIARAKGELRDETREGDRVVSAVVRYAFGSGDKGMTLVGPDDEGRTRELRISLYRDQTLWDVTTGQTSPPQPGADHLGKVLTDDELRSCFYCHTTVARAARDETGPESADPGIGCERCHGPGGNHLLAVSLDLPDLAIARPGPRSGAQVVALCGTCHSPLGTKVVPTDPLAPRFAAASLTWSRCYTETNAGLDCITCHNPHRNAETSPVSYEKKCLECHAKPADGHPKPRGSACPVNPTSGCIECHMPRADNVISHSRFTDHYIRVRRKSD